MNVTLKLPDDLVREARHRAVNQSQSLSAWMAGLVHRELAAPPPAKEEPKSLVEALRLPDAPDWFYEKDFPLPGCKRAKPWKSNRSNISQNSSVTANDRPS
jgi:hypothetical protein